MKFVHFLEGKPVTISCEIQKTKLAKKKTGCKKEGKEKKKRGRQKYRNRLAKKDHILAYAHAQETQTSD